MRVLLIEDDIKLSQVMRVGLEQQSFIVDVANDGGIGENKAFDEEYDVILLDLNLPTRDGMEILTNIRAAEIYTPVIIITARDEVKQRILGLDYGADDYIIKPFDFIEVVARIHAVVRRFQGRANTLLILDVLELNPATQSVKLANEELLLSTREYDILALLMMSENNHVSSEDILEKVFGEQYTEGSSVLRVHIANLRKKLGIYKYALQTMKGRGYRLCFENQKTHKN